MQWELGSASVQLTQQPLVRRELGVAVGKQGPMSLRNEYGGGENEAKGKKEKRIKVSVTMRT